MKILLTGGAGFIGSHLAEKLLQPGNALLILDNFNSFYDPAIKLRNIEQIRAGGEFSLYEGDLLNRRLLGEIFEEHRPDAVVHLAACAGVRPSLENPALYCEVNVTGTAHLLEMARQFEVKHFLFGSSSSVYGINSRLPFREDDPVGQPVSPYAATKRAGELLSFATHQSYGLPVTCLRFFTVYGPRQRPEMAIHKFTRRIVEGEEIEVYHQGRSQRDYTYVDDIVRGTLAALERPDGFQIYNLGHARRVLLLDLIRMIEEALGRKARIRLMPPQPGDVPVTYADISRARVKLGYVPATSLEEGIPRFVRWYRREMEPR